LESASRLSFASGVFEAGHEEFGPSAGPVKNVQVEAWGRPRLASGCSGPRKVGVGRDRATVA